MFEWRIAVRRFRFCLACTGSPQGGLALLFKSSRHPDFDIPSVFSEEATGFFSRFAQPLGFAQADAFAYALARIRSLISIGVNARFIGVRRLVLLDTKLIWSIRVSS